MIPRMRNLNTNFPPYNYHIHLYLGDHTVLIASSNVLTDIQDGRYCKAPRKLESEKHNRLGVFYTM